MAVSARAFAFALALAGFFPGTVSAGPWIEATPAESAEAALQGAFAKGGFAGPQPVVDALRTISATHPGTTASGLAQLAAGLVLLDANRPGDALPFLRHADIPRTGLIDYGLMALARAQEGAGDFAAAGQTYRDAAAGRPDGILACTGFLSAAEAFGRASAFDKSASALDRATTICSPQDAGVLLRIAQIQDSRRDLRAAAEAYERLEREYPASPQAGEGARRLAALTAYLTPLSGEARIERELKKAAALFEAGRFKDTLPSLRSLAARKLAAQEQDRVAVPLGRALFAVGRTREAEEVLGRVSANSPLAGEAAFHLAKVHSAQGRAVEAYEAVVTRFPGTPWAEEALLSLANFFQKDARDEDALPYFRQLLLSFPDGRHADKATWRIAWADYRAGRFEDTALVLERAARLRPMLSSTAGYLYWAGRARREQGQAERSRQLLDEVVRRYKYGYYGGRARDALALYPLSTAMPPPTLRAPTPAPKPVVPAPQAERVRQLLLINRLDEAADELRALPPSVESHATIASIEAQRGRLRPAITAMKRAYPGYLGEAGDLLPPEVWRILYPLEFGDLLKTKAGEEGLDPALVAAIICQESTFDAGAVSRAGARGLMQVIPTTGRLLARNLGVPYRSTALHNPETSLDFGTRYLRQMLDRFGGREERALAAYNAGPHRVDAWTASQPDIAAEEFIESIPFTETRNYVMIILGAREQYRRLYALAGAVASGPGDAPRQ